MLDRSLAAAAVAALLVLTACRSDQPASTAPVTPHSGARASAAADNPLADTLARAVAIALGDPTLRLRLAADLRDSPFPRHALHLRTYLAGAAGRRLRAAVVRQLGDDPAALDALFAALPDLELRLERPYDRAMWRASDSLTIYGTSLRTDVRVRDARIQPGFRTGGAPVAVPIWSAAPFPYAVIQPVETAFGRDPERTRIAAPRLTRATVSSRAEEVASYLLSTCDPDTQSDCAGFIVPDQGGVTLPSQYTRSWCFGLAAPIPASEDRDQDGFRDACEALLAYTFRPDRRMSGSDRAPDGEAKYAATRRVPDANGRADVAIFYALSYYRDPGSPYGSIDAHDGDSEFIIVELHCAEGSRWVADYVTFSAHWNAGAGVDHTARYFQDVLEWTDGARVRVRSWVSDDKHANYRSRSVCMSQWNDFCGYEFSYYQRDTPLVEPANLGGIYNPYTPNVLPLNNCQRSRFPTTYPGIECFWSFQPFGGWHANTGQLMSTTYTQMLGFFGF